MGSGRLRWFGPFLASRISGKVFVNRRGPGAENVEAVTAETCQDNERGHLSDALRWIWFGEVPHG